MEWFHGWMDGWMLGCDSRGLGVIPSAFATPRNRHWGSGWSSGFHLYMERYPAEPFRLIDPHHDPALSEEILPAQSRGLFSKTAVVPCRACHPSQTPFTWPSESSEPPHSILHSNSPSHGFMMLANTVSTFQQCLAQAGKLCCRTARTAGGVKLNPRPSPLNLESLSPKARREFLKEALHPSTTRGLATGIQD